VTRNRLTHSTRAVAVAALALAIAGCGGAQASPQAAGPAPATSNADAAKALAAYDRTNNEVNAAFDVDGLDRIEAPPMRTSSRAWLRIKQELERPIPPSVSKDAKFLSPAGNAHPRWFVAVATSVRGGVPSARPGYTVFVQKSEGAPWLAAYSARPTEPVAPLVTNGAGAVEALSDPTGLAITPAALGAAIFKHYTARTTADQFARTPALDDQLSAGYRVGKEMYAARDWVLSRTLNKSSYPTYALRTKDGGALAFTASVVTDRVKSADEDDSVTLDAGSNEAALNGHPEGLKTRQLTIQRLQMFLTYIPPKANGQQIRVLAYSDTPIKVTSAD